MEGIIPHLTSKAKEKLLTAMRQCPEGRLKTHYLIVLDRSEGHSAAQIAQILQVSVNTVYRVLHRFDEQGEPGLYDRREDNGPHKRDERYLAILHEIVSKTPQDYGWPRPTWTRELLVATMFQKTGVRIHVGTMSRALAEIGARRGKPRPVVVCPWPKAAQNRRLNQIRQLAEHPPPGEVVVYADEVDIHLNPKIGCDWMVPGQQKEVITPGQNVKRYLAGALDANGKHLTTVESDHKNSPLFINLLKKLDATYANAKRVHVIVDNFRIHHSQITQAALRNFDGRIVLYFLPPYCPNDNRIERVWEDLHADVTRNHRCPDIGSLMTQVHRWLCRRNRRMAKTYGRSAA